MDLSVSQSGWDARFHKNNITASQRRLRAATLTASSRQLDIMHCMSLLVLPAPSPRERPASIHWHCCVTPPKQSIRYSTSSSQWLYTRTRTALRGEAFRLFGTVDSNTNTQQAVDTLPCSDDNPQSNQLTFESYFRFIVLAETSVREVLLRFTAAAWHLCQLRTCSTGPQTVHTTHTK